MKVSRSRLNILVLAILLAGLTLSGVWTEAAAPDQTPASVLAVASGDSTATLTVMSGEVTIKLAGASDWQRVLDSSPVGPGDTIKTAADGRALLTFYAVSESLLDSNTEITIESVVVPRGQPFDIKLRLIAGSTWHSVPNFFCFESRYEVDTPTATLSHGTTWWAYVDSSGHTWVNALEGQVEMTGVYTVGIPTDLSLTSTVRTLSEQITWAVTHVDITYPLPQPVESIKSGPPAPGVTDITIINVDQTETQRHVGLGVLAQAFFIAQSLSADQSQQLGCDGACTMYDLVNMKLDKTMSWGSIKKLVDEHGSLGIIRSGRTEPGLIIPPELLKKGGNKGAQGGKDVKADKGGKGSDPACQPGDPCWPNDKGDNGNKGGKSGK